MRNKGSIFSHALKHIGQIFEVGLGWHLQGRSQQVNISDEDVNVWEVDGDVPLSNHRVSPKSLEPETGTLTFRGSTLPWKVGQYEVRYHHDGKYNVLSIDGPFEVYVEKHGSLDFDSVRECLAHIVPLCLDNDPSLIPLSCGGTGTTETSSDADGAVDGPSSDDFTFWSEGQAKRISTAIKEAFDVEYAPDVVMADANLTALAKRILVSKQLLVNS